MPISDEDMIVNSGDYFVTESTLNLESSPNEAVAFLRRTKTTGQLTFHMTQGALQKIALTEKTKAKGKQSTGIRQAMSMEVPPE